MRIDNEYRCPNDDKLLFKGAIVAGTVEIKCKSCKQLVRVEPTPLEEIICTKTNCTNRQVALD